MLKKLLLVGALAAAFSAYGDDEKRGRDVDHVNKSITVDANEVAGNLSTVNGSIRISEGARVEHAETVNGSVRMGARAQADSVETVNGSVTLEADAIVAGNVEAVNGSISLVAGADVTGGVENVNGAIRMERAHVGGEIRTVSGDIEVGTGSRVDGGITVEKPTGFFGIWTEQRPPRVVIGPGAVVTGPLVFEREVELYVHDSARTGAIRGATAKRYSGDKPPALD